MLFHVDMIYLAKQAKGDVEKSLLWDENLNQFEPRTGFLQFYVKTKKVYRCFANFSSEQEHFTHGMYMTALICRSDVKKIELISVTMPLPRKVADATKEQIYLTRFRGSSADAHPCICHQDLCFVYYWKEALHRFYCIPSRKQTKKHGCAGCPVFEGCKQESHLFLSKSILFFPLFSMNYLNFKIRDKGT